MKAVGFTILVILAPSWKWCSNSNNGLVADGFTVTFRSSPLLHRTHPLYSTTEVTPRSDTRTSPAEQEESISDVDARVLRAMLQEKKLTLDTEEDVRKLLERGTVKTVPKPPSKAKTEGGEEYSSQMLKTLADTKLWRKLSTQASELAESVGIWVVNKLEQDVKVIAALGLFAWDRAVNDVARALPATSTVNQKRRPWALTNTSSFVAAASSDTDGASRRRNILEQMNQPVDEIQSVSREIWGILQREGTTPDATVKSTQRGLRTVAPAGSTNAAERQRRAYQQQRQKTQAQQNIPGQILQGGTKITDAAYELQRELKAETNAPGYRTKPIRTAIAAGVTATTNVLKGVREEARAIAAAKKAAALPESTSTFASSAVASSTKDTGSEIDATIDVSFEQAPKTKEEMRRTSYEEQYDWYINGGELDSQSSTAASRSTPLEEIVVTGSETEEEQQESLLVLFRAERYRMVERLTRCIEDPTAAWLTPSVVESLPSNLDSFFSGPGMQETLTNLMLLRDDVRDMIGTTTEDGLTFEALSQMSSQLISIRTSIEDICDSTSNKVSALISDQLRRELLENIGGDGSVGPLHFSDIEGEIPVILRVESLMAQSAGRPSQAKEAPEVIPEMFDVIPDALFVDVIPDAFVMDTHSGEYSVETELDASGAGLMAEIVSDDDFDTAVGAAKVAFSAGDDSEYEEEKKEPNVIAEAALRSLDVALFVVERVLIVGVPSTVGTLSTAATRVEEVNRNGQGSVGWKQLSNLADTKGRY